eukprot:TRINITY_DN24850_c0_g1_i1.p1 TRINITY_DN24850_c0_g1~~TRINITY_DN24850_c0_g1_i1.p1  ORF type:complete len:104 (-),score=11.85 TRINITY_DN24850_c0_g1_i1:492-803(-)
MVHYDDMVADAECTPTQKDTVMEDAFSRKRRAPTDLTEQMPEDRSKIGRPLCPEIDPIYCTTAHNVPCHLRRATLKCTSPTCPFGHSDVFLMLPLRRQDYGNF